MTQDSSEIVIYQTEDGQTKVDVLFTGDSVWLPLDKIARLFGRDKSTISRHLKNIFEDGELEAGATVAKFATVQTEGARQISREIDYYNLNAIIAIGYRVKSLYGAYKKLSAEELSPVECAYLETLRDAQRRIEGKKGAPLSLPRGTPARPWDR